jgi:hypothetical protein
VFLRLDETCWDYSIIFPSAQVLHAPQFAVIIRTSEEAGALQKTLSSLFAQTHQAFEVLITYTPSQAKAILEALPFRCLGRLRILQTPEMEGELQLEEALTRSCRAAYIVRVQAGDWLPEHALLALAESAAVSRVDLTRRSPAHPTSDPGARKAESLLPAPVGVCAELLSAGSERRTAVRDPGLGATDGAPLAAGKAAEGRFCCITFEGGLQSELTFSVLDVLREARQTATFFAIGARVRDNLSLWRRIVSDGHEVGIHGLFHEDLTKCVYGVLEGRLRQCSQLISDCLGVRPQWLRPPFGKSNQSVRALAAQAGLALSWADVTADVVMSAFAVGGVSSDPPELYGKDIACRETHGLLMDSASVCEHVCRVIGGLGLRSVSRSEAGMLRDSSRAVGLIGQGQRTNAVVHGTGARNGDALEGPSNYEVG